PETVSELVMARVRRLSKGEQELLRWAGMVGERVDPTLLSAALGQEEDDVFETLASLEDAGILVGVGDEGEASFAFRHALTREAVHGDLGTADQRRRHQALLIASEALYGADSLEHIEQLLRHARGAGDRGKSFAYSLRAAERAHELGGWSEAAVHLEGAL